jgi:hypothetical protein
MKKYLLLFSAFLFFVPAILIAQVDPQLKWAKSISSIPLGGDVIGTDIVVDANGDKYITGNFAGIADFDPSSGILNLTSNGSTDIFLAKYDAIGNCLWAKVMGGSSDDYGTSLELDANGGIYLTGHFISIADFDPSSGVANLISSGSNDIFLAKYDSNGNYLWAKKIGGSNDNFVTSLGLDSNNNVCLIGNFKGTMDFDPSSGVANLTSSGVNDLFLAKYDVNGSYQWAKKIGTTSDEEITALELDASGNLYITGNFVNTLDFDPSSGIANLTSSGSIDIFLAKYNVNGDYVWAKSIGGTSDDKSNSVVMDSSGNLFITGFFKNTADFDPSAAVANLTSLGGRDIFLAKYNSNGDYLWAQGIEGGFVAQGNSLALDNIGNVYITGYFEYTSDFDPSSGVANLTSMGLKDVFLAKYSTNGNYLWANAIGGSSDDNANSLVIDSNGSVNVVGSFKEDVDFDSSSSVEILSAPSNTINCFVGKYNSSGVYENAIKIGGYSKTEYGDSGEVIATDSNGNIYVSGYFSGTADFDPSSNVVNLTSKGLRDIFIAKYDSYGNYLWANSIEGTGEQDVSALELDANGNIFITGSFRESPDFDPSSGVANLTSNGSQDVFIAKYDSNGNYLWAKSIGGIGYDASGELKLDASNNIYLVGKFMNTVDFNPSSGVANLSAQSLEDIFIAKYDTNGNYLWAKSIGGQFYSESARKLELDANSNLYILGYFRGTVDFDPSAAVANLTASGVYADYFFLAKYDANGNYIWAKDLEFIRGSDIVLDNSGNVFLGGYYDSSSDFDPSSNVVLAGSGAGLFFAKYDFNGNFLWVKGIKSVNNNSGGVSSLFIDTNSNVYMTGYIGGQFDFDPSSGVANLFGSGFASSYIAKYDSVGNYSWANKLGTINSNRSKKMTIDNIGNIYLTGHFDYTTDFDPSSNVYNLTSINGNDTYIAKFKECLAGTPPTVTFSGNTLTSNTSADSYQWIDCNNGNSEILGETNQSFTPLINGNYAVILTIDDCENVSACQNVVLGTESFELDQVKLYPNPIDNNFVIQLPYAYEKASVVIFDLVGKEIFNKDFNFETVLNITLDNVSKGIYFVQLNCDGKSKLFKVIKD